MTIKDSVGYHTQRMETDTNSERERRTNKPLPILPELFENDTCRIPWVQVEGYVEIGKSLPENVPFWLIVEDIIFAICARPLRIID
jgi:hypothetical protein